MKDVVNGQSAVACELARRRSPPLLLLMDERPRGWLGCEWETQRLRMGLFVSSSSTLVNVI